MSSIPLFLLLMFSCLMLSMDMMVSVDAETGRMNSRYGEEGFKLFDFKQFTKPRQNRRGEEEENLVSLYNTSKHKTIYKMTNAKT